MLPPSGILFRGRVGRIKEAERFSLFLQIGRNSTRSDSSDACDGIDFDLIEGREVEHPATLNRDSRTRGGRARTPRGDWDAILVSDLENNSYVSRVFNRNDGTWQRRKPQVVQRSTKATSVILKHTARQMFA